MVDTHVGYFSVNPVISSPHDGFNSEANVGAGGNEIVCLHVTHFLDEGLAERAHGAVSLLVRLSLKDAPGVAVQQIQIGRGQKARVPLIRGARLAHFARHTAVKTNKDVL